MTAPAQPATARPTARNLVGVAALIVGAAGVLVGSVTTLLQPALLQAAGGVQAIQVASAVGLGLRGLLGLTALGLGLVGLLLPDRRRAAAIVGLTLGAVLLVEVLSGLLLTLLYSLA